MSHYLERALTSLRTIGINFIQPVQDAPVLVLLDRVAHYDTTKVTSIATVLQQGLAFDTAQHLKFCLKNQFWAGKSTNLK